MRRAGRGPVSRGVAVTIVLTVLLTAACDDAADGSALNVTADACAGDTWTLPGDGRVSTTVRNTGSDPLRVDLVNPGNRGVYADLPSLAPGTGRTVNLHLPNGTYRWECAELGESTATPVASADRTVTSSSAGTAERVVWVTPGEEQQLSRAYAMGVSLRLAEVRQSVVDLDGAVARGDLARARSLWVAAHGRYTTLGGAYGVFGDAAAAIDGLAEGLPGGPRDPGFTGFHRVEFLLWNGGRPEELRAASGRLRSDVTALSGRSRFLGVPLVEITRQSQAQLEQRLRVQLAGRGDYGSHTQLADLSATVAGTRDLVVRIEPLLASRDPDLGRRALAGVDALAALLQKLQGPGDTWPALADLPQARREGLLAATGGLVELLARIPVTLRTASRGDAD